MDTAPQTELPRIAVITGSTRPGRRTDQVAVWVHRRATDHLHGRAEVVTVDLADQDLPLLDEPLPAAFGEVPAPAHPPVGGARRRLRRLRLRRPRVQPLDARGREERDRLPLRRVERQGGRFRELRDPRRSPGRRASPPRARGDEDRLCPDHGGAEPVRRFRRARHSAAGHVRPGGHHEPALLRMLDEVVEWSTALRTIRAGRAS